MGDNNKDCRATVRRADQIEELRRRLEEAEQTLAAIRQGEVDALVVTGPRGDQVYSLAGAEHVYRVIVETMHEAALTVDPNGTILFCNQRFCDVMKVPIHQAMGRQIAAFVARPQQMPLMKLLADAQAGPIQRRLTLRAADGAPVPVRLAASPLEADGIPSVCLVASDLTELEDSTRSVHILREHQEALEEANDNLRSQEQDLRNHAEALRISQERLALAASGTRIGMYDWNTATGETLWTEQVARLLGLRTTTTTTTTFSQRYHYQDWVRHVHPEDLPRVQAELRRCQAEKAPYEMDYRVVWPDGSVHWVAGRGVFQYDSGGECTRLLGILMDITDRKRAEEAMERQAALIDLTPDAILVRTVDGTIIFWSQGAESLYGWTRQEALGQSSHSLLKTQFPQPLPQILDQVLNTGTWSGELVHFRHEGTQIVVQSRWLLKRRGQDGQSEILESNVDITERKRIEQALRESEARYRIVGETIPYGVWLTDASGYCTYVSDSFLQLVGMTMEQVQRFGWLHLLPPEDVEPTKEHWLRCAATGENFEREHRFHTPEGSYRHVLAIGRPLRNEQGQITAWVGINLDITGRKQAEEALRELNATLESKVAQRTAELEQRTRQLQRLTLELSQAEERERRRLALILHEELQQQIAGAKFHLRLLKGHTTYGPPQQAVVDAVEEMLREAIERSRSLSHDLSPAVLCMNDLAEIFQWLARQVQARHGLDVHVAVVGEIVPSSEALTMFLFRSAQEMLVNVARHAGVRQAALRVRRLGRHVGLCVADRGSGFDPQTLKESRGFGLLSIRERVELLGGRMKIRSAPGRGSRLCLVVPDGPQHRTSARKPEEPKTVCD